MFLYASEWLFTVTLSLLSLVTRFDVFSIHDSPHIVSFGIAIVNKIRLFPYLLKY
jgi:hypothetical protein